jgi:hypothetical protein
VGGKLSPDGAFAEMLSWIGKEPQGLLNPTFANASSVRTPNDAAANPAKRGTGMRTKPNDPILRDLIDHLETKMKQAVVDYIDMCQTASLPKKEAILQLATCMIFTAGQVAAISTVANVNVLTN